MPLLCMEMEYAISAPLPGWKIVLKWLIDLQNLFKNNLLFVCSDREAEYKVSATRITNIVDKPHFGTVYLHKIQHFGYWEFSHTQCRPKFGIEASRRKPRDSWPLNVNNAVSVLIAENIASFTIACKPTPKIVNALLHSQYQLALFSGFLNPGDHDEESGQGIRG